MPQAGKLAWPPPCPETMHTVSSVLAAPQGGFMHEHDGLSMQGWVHHMGMQRYVCMSRHVIQGCLTDL